MYYIIYKTTNKQNGMYYIGIHGTDSLSYDGYLGSGTYLRRAIKTHGKRNFYRETLFVFNTHEEALCKESEIVTENVVNDHKSYNLICGGLGVDGQLAKKNLFREDVFLDRIQKMKETTSTPEYKEKCSLQAKSQHTNPTMKETHVSAVKKSWRDPQKREKRIVALKNSWADPQKRKNRIQTITENGKSNRGRKGIKKNGKIKKVKPSDIQKYLNDGWILMNPT